MICPKWLPIARATLAAPNRFALRRNTRFSSGVAGFRDRISLEEKPRRPSTRGPRASAKKNDTNSKANSLAGYGVEPSGLRDGKHMLTIDGLPTSLRAADFHRLAIDKLSGWGNLISEVRQERDPWTMEPLGKYHVAFSSSAAASLFRHKFERILRIAQFKNRCKTELWASKVPPALLDAGRDPASELERFAILPGSYQGRLEAHQGRVKGKMAWQHVMDAIVKSSRVKTRPSAVLVELPQATFSAAELKAMIHQDGVDSGHRWRTNVLFHLSETLGFRKDMFKNTTRVPLKDDVDFRHKHSSRFVMICENPETAWRFIRSWNQRILEYDMEGVTMRNRVKVSYIEI
ncbi:hypothetical protein BKA59DRAFT_547288 [Fusarium tricinctum]|uniref:Uncharacterized protein n=2 Tax=Fusarium tricinctum species complex TaxID=679429 RepID=A0A8K0RPC4_9HYPO|nr:hypothetical protein BKA59DRAFT_547288 [Fusarium tricinctum]